MKNVEESPLLQTKPSCLDVCGSFSGCDAACVALGMKSFMIAVISQVLYLQAPSCSDFTDYQSSGKDYSGSLIASAIGIGAVFFSCLSSFYFAWGVNHKNRAEQKKYNFLVKANAVIFSVSLIWNTVILGLSTHKCL